MLELAYGYDDLGRVVQIIEDDQGTTRTLDFAYDAIGQLTEVRTDGVVTGSYSYDANGNRLSSLAISNATYSGEDELLSYGTRSYTYSAGQLTSMTDGAITTTYDYAMLERRSVWAPVAGADLASTSTASKLVDDATASPRSLLLAERRAKCGTARSAQPIAARGELLAVDDGTTTIEYEHDPFGRRVGRSVDGVFTQGFLHQDAINPIAELATDGSVHSRFVYATRAHVPDFMVQNGREYTLVTDHLGSVRYVVDTSDGTIAPRLEYDEFGQVISDTNPGFQPFGFAGGLYDRDTGLVRFGVRDYDPFTGRWTARDPIDVAGGQSNLWIYASEDPLNLIDSDGQNPLLIGFVAGAIVGVGAYMFATPRDCWKVTGAVGWGLGGGVAGLLMGAWSGMAAMAATGTAAEAAAAAGVFAGLFGPLANASATTIGYGISTGIDPDRTPTLGGLAMSGSAGAILGPLALWIPGFAGGVGLSGAPALAMGVATKGSLKAVERNALTPGGSTMCGCD